MLCFKKINITLIPQEKDTKSVIMSAKKLYVIANSHMDPIWLWRLREGRSTWLNTCRSVVRMLKKYPFLNFCRSSSSLKPTVQPFRCAISAAKRRWAKTAKR